MAMEILDGLANVFEILANQLLRELCNSEFYFFIECAIFGILEDHVGDVFVFFIIVVEELDDVGMVKFVVDIDFLFSIFAVNLY